MREIRTTSHDEELVSQRRKMIAEKALRVFLEKGYEKATMRDVGRACGMTHGNLYNYVGSKADILHLICVNEALGSAELLPFLTQLGNMSYARKLQECMVFYIEGCEPRSRVLLFFDREIRNFERDDRRILLNSDVQIVSFFDNRK